MRGLLRAVWSRHRPASAPTLPIPLPFAARTAVLSGRFQEQQHVRHWPDCADATLMAWKPEVLAGHREALRAATQRRWPGLCALVLLSGPGDSVLSPQEREWLWERLGAPVFQQFWSGGELLAEECEAHDGLHTRHPVAPWWPNDWALCDAPCPCGQAGARLHLATPELVPATEPAVRAA